jgi:hypothetical protein
MHTPPAATAVSTSAHAGSVIVANATVSAKASAAAIRRVKAA